jgi:mannose-6-phosphate isomerase-like protein (cupin superfamily)
MDQARNIKDIEPIQLPGHFVYHLLDEKDGYACGSVCVGCYTKDEDFLITGAHEDQEVFYVLEGTGFAKVGDSIIPLKPGTCFLVKPGQTHGIKRDSSCEFVKVLFFHAAV